MIANHDRWPQRKLGGRREERYPTAWDAPASTLCVGGDYTQGKRSGGASSPVHPSYYEGPLRKESDIIDEYNVTPQLESNGFTVAELFAGGGLMAIGLRSAGYNLVWANDFDKNAVKAYRHNLGDHIVHGDITAIDIDSIPDADVIAGGPPCQDYSVAGTGAGEEGERGKLVWRYLEIIERKRPKAFVFENVKGLITKRHRPTFDALLRQFKIIGYNVSWRLINAWDYGVAQKRERVFIVGVRADLGFAFEFPEPRPEDYRTQVLRDVIGDLPEPTDTCGRNVKKAERVADMDEPAPVITTQFRCQTVEITNHNGGIAAKEYPGHTASNLDEPAKTVVAGANGVPGGANCFYPNHERKEISEKALAGYERRGGQGGFGFRVNEWDDPSPTIFGRIFNEGKAFVHPQAMPQPRRFTVRECLRIQSVPDSYVLPDDISLSAQYRIVGNGVASRVSYLLGVALAEQLRVATESNAIGERLISDCANSPGSCEREAV